jgi:hypothetical protein
MKKMIYFAILILSMVACKKTTYYYAAQFDCENGLQDTLLIHSCIQGHNFDSIAPNAQKHIWTSISESEKCPDDWYAFALSRKETDAPNLALFNYKGRFYLDMGQNERSVLNIDSYSEIGDETQENILALYAHRYVFRIDEDYLNSLIKIDSNADVESVMASYLE